MGRTSRLAASWKGDRPRMGIVISECLGCVGDGIWSVKEHC